MFFGFKYHIFTITAIFAALGIGIVIGTSLIGDDMFIQEQERLIENIKNNIQQINEENVGLQNNIKDLKDELNYRKDREKKILSLLVKEQFGDREYLLYPGQNFEDYEEQINEIGLEFKIIEDLENLIENDIKKPGSYSKLIVWNTEATDGQISEELEITEYLSRKNIKTIYYDRPDLMGLILNLLESEMDDKSEPT